jgi:hypothetical protein
MRMVPRRRDGWLVVTCTLSLSVFSGTGSADDGAKAEPAAGHRPAYLRQRGLGRYPSVGLPYGGPAARRMRPAPPDGAGSFRPQGQTEAHASGGAWFQRPYPYHLDFYRMRYGGTYEPYFGGSPYGPPPIIVTPTYGYGPPFAGAYPYAPMGGMLTPEVAAPQVQPATPPVASPLETELDAQGGEHRDVGS